MIIIAACVLAAVVLFIGADYERRGSRAWRKGRRPAQPSLYDHWRARTDRIPRTCAIWTGSNSCLNRRGAYDTMREHPWPWADSAADVVRYITAVEKYIAGDADALEDVREYAVPLFERYENRALEKCRCPRTRIWTDSRGINVQMTSDRDPCEICQMYYPDQDCVRKRIAEWQAGHSSTG